MANRMSKIVLEVVGWLGMFLILLAYGLSVGEVWIFNSVMYLLTNLLGGVLIAVNCVYKKAWPAFGLNVAWVAIAIVVLIGKI